MSLQASVEAQALKYLGCDQSGSVQLRPALDRAFCELQSKATPRFVTKVYPLTHNPLMAEGLPCQLDYPELRKLFARCDQVCVIGATLGREIERYTTYLSKFDMAYMVVFDAMASSYLEYVCDAYEESLALGLRTFRYCPGYGSVDLSLNAHLAKALQMDKHIGLNVQPTYLLLPQKSMIGLIGLGDSGEEKSCGTCPRIQNCAYRKKEQRCYKIN